MTPYRFIDHTADLGIRIEAPSLSALFEDAAGALAELLLAPHRVRPLRDLPLEASGETWDDLLINWLRTLLFQFQVEARALVTFKIVSLAPFQLHAVASGEALDPARHGLKTEIKGVTYHGLWVRQYGARWCAQVIFDI